MRLVIPCLALAISLTGAGAFSIDKPKPVFKAGANCENPDKTVPDYVRLKPLADLLARGEGNYNSVNRGRAGDTPGGIRSITGRDFDYYTVAQVIHLQRWQVYAVGRYQFIPSTLRFAVAMSDVELTDKFTPKAQDKLMAALILFKRPAIGAYLRGDHDYIGWALDQLAKEWASVEYRNGRGFYDHVAGNRAHISRKEAWQVLQNIKKGWQADLGCVQ